MRALVRESVTIPDPSCRVTVPAEELEEALWLGLLERAKKWRRIRDHARKNQDRLLADGPEGESNPYRKNPPDIALRCWKELLDGWARRITEASNMARALEALHDHMADD